MCQAFMKRDCVPNILTYPSLFNYQMQMEGGKWKINSCCRLQVASVIFQKSEVRNQVAFCLLSSGTLTTAILPFDVLSSVF